MLQYHFFTQSNRNKKNPCKTNEVFKQLASDIIFVHLKIKKYIVLIDKIYYFFQDFFKMSELFAQDFLCLPSDRIHLTYCLIIIVAQKLKQFWNLLCMRFFFINGVQVYTCYLSILQNLP